MSQKIEKKILYPKMFWLGIKNNVFSCKNQKLGLNKSSKGPLIFQKILFFILFDIITPIPW